MKINFAGALQRLVKQGMQPLVADQIRKELVITYRNANDKIDIFSLQDPDYDYTEPVQMENVDLTQLCSASVFAEKLWNVRNLYGTIKEICRAFGSIEVLEQYGNYMRLRVSRQDKTIG